MRILRIYPFLPPLRGGMEKHILRLTEEQRHLGCEVTIAFNQGEATASGDIRVLPRFNLRKVKPQALRDLIFYCGLFLKLTGQWKRFDVVHVHGDWSAFFLGRLVAYLVRAKKSVASIHDVVKRQNLYRFALAGYNLIYTTGARDAESLVEFSKGVVHWQHSGIDTVFHIPKDGNNPSFDIVTVGSFVPKKNFELVIKIAASMPDVTFLLVGDGPLKTELETTCRQRDIVNVTFTGHLEPDGVARQLRRARIFLLTSFAEGTPTALLEAMASGLAIVTSRSNIYDDLVKPGENGYVIDGFQVENYVLKIRELLNDDKWLDAISRCNSEQAIPYAWPHVAKRITNWMQSS